MNKLGLYIHIPFCQKICYYCDFVKRVSNEDTKKKYLHSLIGEIEYYQNQHLNFSQFDTIYIGGGTPSALGLDLLEELFKKIASLNIPFSEYTIELNPEDLYLINNDNPLITLLIKYHINRVSIGLQATSEKLLKIINRDFNFERFKEGFNYLKKHINNINIDLMYAIPTQTLADLEESLNYVLSFKPTHLSIYSLILEPKTVFNYLYQHHKLTLIDEDVELKMAKLIQDKLQHYYEHYEVSNYCLINNHINYQSQHNLKYWLNQEYLGLGLGAASYLNNKRFSNTPDLNKYLFFNQSIHEHENVELLNIAEQKKYELILGLRLLKGLNLNDYFDKYHSSIFDDFPNVKSLISENYLIIQDNHLFINPQYLYVMNSILIKII